MDEPFQIEFLEPQPEHLSKVQSLAFVHIFLNAAIACIAHTRGLIPWTSPCFQIRNVNQLTSDNNVEEEPYKAFCNLDTPGNPRTQEFRILRRGYDKRADSILDILDTGIIEAIKDGYLAAVQIFVTSNCSDPTTIFESYKFVVQYDQKGVSEIQVSSQNKNVFNVNDMHKSFASAIRSLLREMTDTSPLPRKRALGASLTYNNSCPQSYQPTGFVDARQVWPSQTHVSWENLWQVKTNSFATFDTGKYCIKVGAHRLAFSEGLSYSQMQDSKVSAQLRGMQRTSSNDPDLVSTFPTREIRPVINHNQKVAAAPTLRQPTKLSNKKLAKRARSYEHGESTARKRNVQIGSRQRSSHVASSFAQSPNNLGNLGIRAKARRKRNVVAAKIAELMVQARATENEHIGEQTLFVAEQLEQGIIQRTNLEGEIQCECGSSHVTDDMLFCELCGTQQHERCYGYAGLRNGGKPDEHFCYNCLLLPREVEVNNGMPGLVYMRLALLYLSQLPTSTVLIDDTFATAISPEQKATNSDFARTVGRLVEEGYLSEPIEGVARIVAGAENLDTAQTSYLDPLAGITHHYETLRDGERPRDRREKVELALTSYFDHREPTLSDETNSHYDCIHVTDNTGRRVIRWGFYAGWKRSGGSGRIIEEHKQSILGSFVNIDRSSESTSLDVVLTEALMEADCEMRLMSRATSLGNEFN